MQLWFARETEVSLREQIVTQVALGILCGELAPGQRLPSIRELARRFRLHPNTVSAGYRQLDRERWVEFRRGSAVGRLNCYFERATEDQLVCQPLQRRAPVIGPWTYPVPLPRQPSPPDYVFERQKVQEVRLEHSEGVNELIGAAIGGSAGAALGAARFECEGCRQAGALIVGGIGAFIGGAVGRISPLFHRRVVYER
ncbi:MAG: GntR family transcriptional regulator [Candidatus Acidiferrales bacterium]